MPNSYNSLENPALRRNAPFLNEPIIHQIWLGGGEISQLRGKLHQTIKDVNKGFQVLLWTKDNITREKTPLTYSYIHKILEHNKETKNSIYAMAADLLRYELLFRYGGIYADFKFEAKKSLRPFLKYPIFFVDCDISYLRLGSPKVVGNGIMGSTPNNYYISIILHELID